jgi:hypothetical protein
MDVKETRSGAVMPPNTFSAKGRDWQLENIVTRLLAMLLAGRGRPSHACTGHWLAAAGCFLALAGFGVL